MNRYSDFGENVRIIGFGPLGEGLVIYVDHM